MRQKLRALIRAGARWLFLLIILVLFAAFMPFGHALWSKALGVSGEVVIGATEADGASPGLEYVDAGTACEPEPMVWALVSNVGRADVASATEVELWFGQDPDAALAQFAGLVQLGEIEAGVSLRVSHPASSGSGSYAFRLYQEPGSLSGVATWSDRIEFDLGQCLAVPAEPASTTTTVPSTTTVPVTTTTTTTTVPVTTTTTTTTVPVTTTTTTTTVPVTTTTTTVPVTTTTTTVPVTTTTTTVPVTTTTTTVPVTTTTTTTPATATTTTSTPP